MGKGRKRQSKIKRGLNHHPIVTPIMEQLQEYAQRHNALVSMVRDLTFHSQALAELLVTHTDITEEQFRTRMDEVRERFQ